MGASDQMRDSRIPVIIAGLDGISGVTAWANRLKRAFACNEKYRIVLINCRQTNNRVGAFDVTTPLHHAWADGDTSWYALDGPGFWKPGPHLVLEGRFTYPEHDTALEQYTVIEPDGTITLYRNWFHDYTPNTIIPVLEAAGFTVRGHYADLCGTPYTPASWWVGMVVEKPL